MNNFSDVHYAVLRLLADCGWVSQSVLALTGYSYPYMVRAVKTLLDRQLIRKQGKGKDKSYALTIMGRNHMAAFNAGRFRGEVMAGARQRARHPERSVLRGDAAAMLALAGFSVNQDDKPCFPAYTPPLPEKPGREDWSGLHLDPIPFFYPDAADRHPYLRRSAAVGCYYDATNIKELLRCAGKDGSGVSYSRACGVLMTPDSLFRVYHSRDVAMKFHVTGENNLHSLLLSGLAFRGHIPKQDNAALIFGSDFTAAQHILAGSLNNKNTRMPIYAKNKGQKGYAEIKGAVGEMLSPTNLGSPAFYLPLRKESLPLLELMRYPRWQEMMLREINCGLFEGDDLTHWTFERDGYEVYVLAALNLAQIDFALRRIKNGAHSKVRIICVDWQEPLLCLLLQSFPHSGEVQITSLPSDYMESMSDAFTRFWEG